MKWIAVLLGVTIMAFGDDSPYIPPHHPMLQEQSKGISLKEISSEKIQGIIDNMLEIALEERKEGRMVGLAAPQVGIPLQIILVDMKISPERLDFSHPPEVFINPVITWKSEDIEEFREGCFSTGSLAGMVPRHQSVHVEAYNRKGEKVKLELEGYTARIFQHEVDHLNGLRFPDRITNFENLHWVEADEIEEYRANFENWPKKCSKDEWLSFIKEAPPQL